MSHAGPERLTPAHSKQAGEILPVYGSQQAAARGASSFETGIMPGKQPKDYYLDGLAAVFHKGFAINEAICFETRFANAEVALLHPGPTAVEVSGILNRFPDLKRLHVIASCEGHLNAVRSELQKEAGSRLSWLPETAGYIADLRHLPEELGGRCDLVVEINVVDPRANVTFREQVAREIGRILKAGGLFYSAGVTIRWTEGSVPPTLTPVSTPSKILKHIGYSDALPSPVFYLKPGAGVRAGKSGEPVLPRWTGKIRTLLGQGKEQPEDSPVEAPFVPRVEDGQGEPNLAPWDFLITKPAVRRPPMEWMPGEGDRFGGITLGMLLQFNAQTGMHVFRAREHPGVVLKIMKPFDGDLPDDPLEWNSLRKSKTLKRENGALKILKGLDFIPQRIAHGYDPGTGWYAIVVEHEKSHTLREFIDWQHNRLHRHHETGAEVGRAVGTLLTVLNSLEIIHARGLVHLDLKPEHVFLRQGSSQAVFIDWGLARKVDEPLSEERRSGSWVHAPPERSDLNVLCTAATHQDLYSVGVMLLQLATDMNLNEHPRLLIDHFFRHGRTPSVAEMERVLRPLWKWAAPVIARAIRSQKDIPGYADDRYTSAREMAEDIGRHWPVHTNPSAEETIAATRTPTV